MFLSTFRYHNLWNISFLALSFLILTPHQSIALPPPVCPTGDTECSNAPPGSLRPHHLPPPTIFTNFDNNNNEKDGSQNTTITLPNGMTRTIATGRVRQINNITSDRSSVDVNFAIMENAVDRVAIYKVIKLLRIYDNFDVDPDTVDGMPTYEIFLDSDDLRDDRPGIKLLDSDPKEKPKRWELRRQIREILDPYLDNALTPYVRRRFAAACNRPGRRCTPCYSLIRRYRHDERESHNTHYDGHAFATVVVSLSDYGVEYRGGLYVSTGHGQREFLGLKRGDAVFHQSSLLHGVKVYDLEREPEKTERWSWILWYRDSDTCEDHSHEWFAACAAAGDALCQQLHATHIKSIPGISPDDAAHQIMTLNRDAAIGGAGTAAVKIARAYLKMLPSSLPFDMDEARRYYEMAIRSNCPDGHYGMAHIILVQLSNERRPSRQHKREELTKVIRHLEGAARLNHVFAMFNLGMAHVFGYGVPAIDMERGAEWFAASGLPEGYFLSSQQAASVNDKERERRHDERARSLGFFAPWRKEARNRTGSGGAAGVDINLPWPVAEDGRKPPTF